MSAAPIQLGIGFVAYSPLGRGFLTQGDDIVPIPGTKHRARLEENVAADAVTLSREELYEIERIARRGRGLALSGRGDELGESLSFSAKPRAQSTASSTNLRYRPSGNAGGLG